MSNTTGPNHGTIAENLNQENPAFSFVVPTSSVIAIDAKDPLKVWVIKHHPSKHKGRMTLVGGKVKLDDEQSHADCMREEWQEEVGGKGAYLIDLGRWAVRTDANADVRMVTLGKVTHDHCPVELRNLVVRARYGVPDVIYTGRVGGIPAPNDHEAECCLAFDLRQLKITETEEESIFGAQHDLILAVYYLERLGRPTWNLLADFADMRALRKKLLDIQSLHIHSNGQ